MVPANPTGLYYNQKTVSVSLLAGDLVAVQLSFPPSLEPLDPRIVASFRATASLG